VGAVRVSVAAAVGKQIVVAAVSSLLYFSYAASLHSRVDGTLVDAAQQASSIAQRIKQSVASGKESKADFSKPMETIEALPMSAAGKILKRELRVRPAVLEEGK